MVNIFIASITRIQLQKILIFLTVESEEIHSTVWRHCIRNQSLTLKYWCVRVCVCGAGLASLNNEPYIWKSFGYL